jgi:hypothetical protein
MSPHHVGDDRGRDSCAVLLSAECRALRRALRPLVWVTLEEVALSSVVEDGRPVARTSARQVAECLGVDPGTAATALRILRERGLVSLSREKGPAGRFGLSLYELRPVAGVLVIQPRTTEPFMVSPWVVQPALAEPAVASPGAGAPHVESPRLDSPDPGWHDGPAPGTVGTDAVPFPVAADPNSSAVTQGEGSACRSGPSAASSFESAPSLQSPGQETFDLGRCRREGVSSCLPGGVACAGWELMPGGGRRGLSLAGQGGRRR